MQPSKKKKYIVQFEPNGLKIEVPAGTSLLEAAHKAGVYLTSICGGDGYCGKCKVIIDEGQFHSRPTSLLTPDETRENVVLACQSKVLSDMIITVPKFHTLQTSQILMDSDAHRFSELAGNVQAGVFKFDPLVRKLCVQMLPPTIHDHTADHERLYVAIREKIDAPIMQTGFRILQSLSKLLIEAQYKVAVTIGRRGGTTEVIEVEPGERCETNFAAAIDLGTTTVVAHLIDLTDGSTIDTEATYNSQLNFGEDYIRRIIYGEQNDAFDELQDRLVNDVNNLIMTLATRQKVDLQDITAIICAGNTAMAHFFLNLNLTRIRREPYVASVAFMPPIRAAEVGIQINKRGLLYCLPSVAAYVGSDIVAGVLTTRMYTSKGISLFIDIGTNGEVVLGNRDWLVCASSSAGPAFEGSGVKNGMRAASGAIEKLTILPDGSVEYKTIGDVCPVGICGSGLLDTLGELFMKGIIDRTGRFQKSDDLRLTEDDEGLQFQLVPPGNNSQEIVITQADINNLIRSKAGVFAAIHVLMNSTQTDIEDIDTIYIAGGFGNFLNVKQAVNIGMLPDVPLQKIRFVGNTSITGAKTVLLSRKALEASEEIADNMTYFDLMNHPGYMEEFIRASFIPHTDLSLFPSVKLEREKV
ncbi:ASKHA domain-containing protein [Planctomycetota bacterium]